MHQVFGSLNVISDTLFPESEVQITIVVIDIVFHAAAVKVFDLAFMRAGAPGFAISFAHLSMLEFRPGRYTLLAPIRILLTTSFQSACRDDY